MRNNLLVALSVAATLLFTACGSNNKDKNSTSRTNGNNIRGGVSVPAAPSGVSSSIWAQVNTSSGQVTSGMAPGLSMNSNDVSRYFLSTDWAWGAIGATSTTTDTNWNSAIFGTPASYTQIPCNGSNCVVGMTMGTNPSGSSSAPMVFTSNQTLSAVVASNQQVAPSSGGITMGFWDSLTGTADPSGGVVPAIPVNVGLQTQGSYVQGNKVNLVFSDGEGTITVIGTLSGSGVNYTLSGTIGFTNQTSVNTINGQTSVASGTLGQFSGNACAFFRCQ